MYVPPSYRISDQPVLHDFITRYSFGTLFTQTDTGPFATHVPFLLDRGNGPNGTLAGHVARANPHWRSFSSSTEVLVTFMGPHAYVSPSWYTSPVAVPTWNYTTVHAYGIAAVVENREWLRSHVLRMVDEHREANTPPWDPAHTDSIIDTMLEAIVGFEIPITRLEGKYKLSQNRSREDQEGVANALSAEPSDDAKSVATLMHRNLATP